MAPATRSPRRSDAMEAVVNRETPLAELEGGVAMPTARVYIQNDFPTPARDPARWRLRAGGWSAGT
jgi:hypothetical protein